MENAPHSIGTGSIAVGRDVIRSLLITGNGNTVFVGDYERVRDAYIEPWSVFEKLHLDRFTGRKWLIKTIDRFLKEQDSGYFILEAEAGLGKSAFMAYLVQERHYLHHFVELAPGDDGIAKGLRNLAAQLVVAWKLNAHRVQEILPRAAARPDFFAKLLAEAAARRDVEKPDEKIVLVVDALDEAGTPLGQNVLGLPSVLPKGVYILVSQRPIGVALHPEKAPCVVALNARSKENWTDMRRYLEVAATWPSVARALTDKGYSPEEFVETLLNRAEGVWIYLHYVVSEIEGSAELDLAVLPHGLWQYYARYWQRWRDREPDQWDQRYLPLLSTLAAVQEAVSCGLLCSLANIPEQGIRRLLDEHWSPFVARRSSVDPRYRLYHASLREFFDGRANHQHLTQQQVRFTEELAASVSEMHNRIAARYIQAWGGLEKGLPTLQALETYGPENAYGLRHLVAHLAEADRGHDLWELLRVTWYGVRESNAWYEVHERLDESGGYVQDIVRAWGLVRKQSIQYAARGEPIATLGLEVRLVLILTSINSLAANLPVRLLKKLVRSGVWNPIKGLANIRQIPDETRRTQALTALAAHLSHEQLAEALAIARQINGAPSRALALGGIAAYLSEQQRPLVLEEALAIADQIDDASDRSEALGDIARTLAATGHGDDAIAVVNDTHLSDGALERIATALAAAGQGACASAVVRQILDTNRRNQVSRSIAPFPAAAGWGAEAFAIARTISDAHLRDVALRDIATTLAAVGRGVEALEAALLIGDANLHFWAREGIATTLAAAGQGTEALAIGRQIKDRAHRAVVLGGIAPYLSAEQRHSVIEEALAIVREFDDTRIRNHSLKRIATAVAAAGQAAEALAIARQITEAPSRAVTLACIAPYLSSQQRSSVLDEALWIARQIKDTYYYALALGGIVRHLSEEQRPLVLEETLAILRQIKDANIEWLVDIAAYLGPVQLSEELTNVCQIKDARSRDKALERIATTLSVKGHGAEALALTHQIKDAPSRDEVLERLIRYLSEGQYPLVLEEALAIAGQIKDAEHRARVLSDIARYPAAAGRGAEAIAIVRQIEHIYYRDEALEHIAPYLGPDHLSEALAITRQMENAQHVLKAIAPRLRLEHFPEALAIASQIENVFIRDEVFRAIAPYVAAAGQGTEALAIARQIEDAYFRDNALGAIAPSLGSEQLLEGLSIARQIEDAYSRDQALKDIATALAVAGRGTEALAIAYQIKEASLGAAALGNIAPYLSDEQCSLVVTEALVIARQIKDARPRDHALKCIATTLATAGQGTEAIAIARRIDDASIRARVLRDTAPYLGPEQLSEAQAIAREIEDAPDRAMALGGITPYLSAEQRPLVQDEALAIARQIKDAHYCALALGGIVRHLSAEQRPLVVAEALAIVHEIKKDRPRAQALEDIAPYLSAQQLSEALVIAREIEDAPDRADALGGIAPYLSAEQLSEALAIARQIEGIEFACFRDKAFKDIATALAAAGRGTEALAIAYQIKAASLSATALGNIAPYLSEERRPLVLGAAFAITDKIDNARARSQALIDIAPHLQLVTSTRFYSLWDTLLQIASSYTRKEMHNLISVLPSLLIERGSLLTSSEIAYALRDVARWWP